MPDKRDGKQKKQGETIGLGVALGLCFGAAISLALDNWAFVGAGLAFGIAISAALSERK